MYRVLNLVALSYLLLIPSLLFVLHRKELLNIWSFICLLLLLCFSVIRLLVAYEDGGQKRVRRYRYPLHDDRSV